MARLKIYHLGTCTTCQGILKEWNASSKAVLQDIKTEQMTEAQVDEMASMAGGYEAIFSKRALKYKEWGLAKAGLKEPDFRKYILEEYTFLKRPVAIVDDQIFVGNAPSTVKAAAEAIAAWNRANG